MDATEPGTVVEDLAFNPAAGDRIVIISPLSLPGAAIANIRALWQRWMDGPAEMPLVLDGGLRLAVLRPLAPPAAGPAEDRAS